MKLYTPTVKLLKQNQAQRAGSHKQPLKNRFTTFIIEIHTLIATAFANSVKTILKTTVANGSNLISFAASFFREAMVQQWYQQKRCHLEA